MLSILRSARDRLDQIGAEPDPVYDAPKPTWEVQPNEQDYAKLQYGDVKEENCYGQKIDLLELSDNKIPVDESLFINANPAASDNPNRYKQHGFYFNADNCIGCHACEAACSEKNGNPAHLSFRSVGYVEGGTYPDFHRMNISMACNHCDDPVCLKGCPTAAYTKHLEYGAVLQDPDTCFGCGYCTWVCPYNAPQLDPLEGEVSKCNMCVDRLEEGLKPACASACLGNALDFGVIEDIPENREQALTKIPGFPDPEITQPNIRFQQTKTLPNEVTRTDSMPVKYAKDSSGQFRSVVDEKAGKEKHWNLHRLSSRENPLVFFTLASQGAIGAFLMLFVLGWGASGFVDSLAYFGCLLTLMGLQAGALIFSTIHLGKPLRFYRGFNNLRHSPLSREALGIALFMAGLSGFTLLRLLNTWLQWPVLGWAAQLMGGLACVSALAGLWFMHKIYRIKARPYWNHWQVITSFFGTCLSLGGILLGLFWLPHLAGSGAATANASVLLGGVISAGLAMELVGLWRHARYLNTEAGEGAAAHYIQCTTFGKTYRLRNGLLILGLVLALAVALMPLAPITQFILLAVLTLVTLAGLVIGRALFYVLVIPTTMPGAFFWKNKGFEEHARDIGLAEMPQVGVLAELH